MAATSLNIYLKAIDNNRFQDIDVVDFSKKFKHCAKEIGDTLQYKLYLYCKKDLKIKDDEAIVYKLSKLCYCDESISGFTNISRFIGCVYYICLYFLKRGMYKSALEVSEALMKKSESIVKTSNEDRSVRNSLYTLHSQFMVSAQELANSTDKKNSINVTLSDCLAQTSITFLQLIQQEDDKTAKKVIRTLKFYFSEIKYYSEDSIRKIFTDCSNILKVISPGYNEVAMLAFYVHRLNQIFLKDDFEDFKSNVRKGIHLIMCCTDNLKMMTFWDELIDFFIAPLSSNFKQFKVCFEKINHINKSVSQLYMLLVSSLVHHSVQVWNKFHANDWAQVLSADFVKYLFKEVIVCLKEKTGDLSSFYLAPVAENEICLSDFIVLNLSEIVYLIRLCLKHNVDYALSLVDLSRQAFAFSRECFNRIRMHGKTCTTQVEPSWKQLIVHYTNTVEDLLSLSFTSSCWSHLRNCCEDLFIEIVQTDFSLPYDQDRVQVLLLRWHYATMKMQDFREALFICVFYLVSFPENTDKVLPLWVQAKMETLQEDLTMADVLLFDQDRIMKMNPQLETSTLLAKSLLLLELRAYDECASVPLNDSVLKVCSQLKSFKLEIFESSFALKCMILANVASADPKTIQSYKKKCSQMTDSLIRISTKDRVRSFIHSGNLKYSLFLCDLKSVQDSEDPSNSTLSVLNFLREEEEEKIKLGDDVDMNLTCNVMPSSGQLTVKLEENFISSLNNIIAFWRKAAQGISFSSLEPREFHTWLCNLRQVAYLYELLGDVYQSADAWLLYYKIAEASESASGKLLALSSLIRFFSNADEAGFIDEGDEISQGLLVKGKEKEILIRFWLAAASNLLRKKNSERCLKYLSQIKETMGSVKSPVIYYIFEGRFLCLASQFCTLYPDLITQLGFNADADVRALACKAFKYISSGVKVPMTRTEDSEIMLAMQEVNMWAVDLYGAYQQTSCMRLFLEDLYQFAQRLMLPTRTAESLLRLAEIDIICRKPEDCQIKLEKLKSILQINSLDKKQLEKFNKTQALFLEVPSGLASRRAISPTRFVDSLNCEHERDPSPVRFCLADEEVQRHATHPCNCTCYSCKIVLIQILTANVRAVEGQVNAMQGFQRNAYPCFVDSSERWKKIKSDRREQSQRLSNEVQKSRPVRTDLGFQQSLVNFPAVKFLLNYSIFELSAALGKDVLETMSPLFDNLDKAMESLSFERKLLQASLVELKIFTLCAVRSKNEASNNVSPVVQKTRAEAKTPYVPQRRKSPQNRMPAKAKPCKKLTSPINVKKVGHGARKILTDKDEEEPVETVKMPTKKRSNQPKHLKTPLLTSKPVGPLPSCIPTKSVNNSQAKNNPAKAPGKKVFPKTPSAGGKCLNKKVIFESSEDETPPVITVVKKQPEKPQRTRGGRRLQMEEEPGKTPEEAKKANEISKPQRSARQDSDVVVVCQAQKKSFNETVDLFTSFEEQLKIWDETTSKNSSSSNSLNDESVIVVEVKKTTRSMRKKRV